MSIAVAVQPQVLRWARERVSLAPAELAAQLGWKTAQRIERWEETGDLTMAHLERLAQKTHTPIGYLFLPDPPTDNLPIADFRTVASQGAEKPSPDLLTTIYTCQQRQDWFREHLARQDEEPLPWVGRTRTTDDPVAVAAEIRTVIGFDFAARAALPTWAEALRAMVTGCEEAGIMVMRNGVVGNNTHRKLNVQEFRGFALSDPYAPLVFVNAADAQAAQMFTLAHEVAHLWLGATGVSEWRSQTTRETERFCNAVAAEVLVPTEAFIAAWSDSADTTGLVNRLARQFKTSSLVILIRAKEAGRLSETEFEGLYAQELSRLNAVKGGSGGDFYQTQGSRLGKRFARAVTVSTLEGETSYTEALELLGLKNSEHLNKLAASLGVVP